VAYLIAPMVLCSAGDCADSRGVGEAINYRPNHVCSVVPSIVVVPRRIEGSRQLGATCGRNRACQRRG
jgi:hypothetical protein